jgi:C-8 sterol isomerase
MKWLFILTLLGSVFIGLDQIKERWFIFDQNVLQQVAQRNIAKYSGSNDTHAMIANIAADLEKEYPGHISIEEEWVFNNAGGAMGSMWMLHASITEYVIIFGTPVGTEGHTGRFLADDYFIILEGEQWAYYAGQLEREVYKPGDMHHLARGTAQQYKIPEHAWALEYARGWVPAMLPFGLFDTLFSTVDFVTLFNTFRLYGKSLIREFAQGKI